MAMDNKPTPTSKLVPKDINNNVDYSKRDFPAQLPGPEYKMKLAWRNIIIFLVLHISGLYGVFLPLKNSWTLLFSAVYLTSGAMGVTSGAHRLFTHKCYKANAPLKILLIAMQTIALQNSVYIWSRDHRMHHKYCDTNGDPHNSRRGFFFCHMGWLLCKKHPDIAKYGPTIDLSDLKADPYVMFQHRHYIPLILLMTFALPTFVAWYLFGESFWKSLLFAGVFRYVLSLHMAWQINSSAHFFGMRPFDKNFTAVDNAWTSLTTLGEAFHNYHHVFPWDYKAAELNSYVCNWSIAFIDFFAKIGWATELKTVSDDLIKKRVMRTGEGSHRYSKAGKVEDHGFQHNEDEPAVWGWDDAPEKDKRHATIF